GYTIINEKPKNSKSNYKYGEIILLQLERYREAIKNAENQKNTIHEINLKMQYGALNNLIKDYMEDSQDFLNGLQASIQKYNNEFIQRIVLYKGKIRSVYIVDDIIKMSGIDWLNIVNKNINFNQCDICGRIYIVKNGNKNAKYCSEKCSANAKYTRGKQNPTIYLRNKIDKKIFQRWNRTRNEKHDSNLEKAYHIFLYDYFRPTSIILKRSVKEEKLNESDYTKWLQNVDKIMQKNNEEFLIWFNETELETLNI
ncbi:MAG: hypothetical protein GX306_01540, partial [Clostridiales bacterium]|nr:hypothetical protein [Clostridiales bacterium]